MLTIRIAVRVLFIQTSLCSALSDTTFRLNNVGLNECFSGQLGKGCVDLRWVSSSRVFVPVSGKCLGAQGKTEGARLSLYDCDETSELQKWECKNKTLVLQGQNLAMQMNSKNDLVLSKDMGPRSQFTISGTSDSPCSRTYREIFTIEGTGLGQPCQFPFYYKNIWYGDCTTFDQSNKRAWCSTTTKYEGNERWGYCPTQSTEFWNKNPETEVFYQVNDGSSLTWHEARVSCQQQDSELLSISELHERAYITGILSSKHLKLWIGLNSLNQDSGWQWSSRKPFCYLRWDAGHPLPHPGHNCALINTAMQSNWQSGLCRSKLGYICQKGGKTPRPLDPVEPGFCVDPWIPYAGHCYQIQRDKKAWLEAKKQCRKEEGDLVSIHNIEEQGFVISQLGYVASDDLWIGLNDQRTAFLFEWSDQSGVSFTHWQFGEPSHINHQREDCVTITGAEGRWSDSVCENKRGFICKKSSATKPSGDPLQTNPGCKPGWRRYGSYCHLTGSETKTFEEARAACLSSESDLVDISNGVDNAFLVSLVGMRAENYFWIGLSNMKNIDFFEWTNERMVSYTHWNANMPGRRQGCVAITTGLLAGLWDVLSCTAKQKYICKHQAEGVVPTLAPVTPAPPSCAEGWTPIGDRNICYKFFTGPRSGEKTWLESREYCRAIGGDLLSLHSLAEESLIRNGKGWIGLSAPDGSYTWSDGSPLSFQNWAEGEPNNHMNVESCVEHYGYNWHDTGTWNDAQCDSYNDWLCQIYKGVTPKPPPNDTVSDYNITADGWLEHMGNQYYINSDTMSMEKARHFCQRNHGDLAVFNKLAENNFIWKQISRIYGNYYIGLIMDFDTSFGWIDRAPVGFMNWDQDQPSFQNNDENCVSMEYRTGFWRNTNCGSPLRSVCERSGSPPVNSTVAPTPAPQGGCPSDWFRFMSKCYKLVQTHQETWYQARSHCQDLAGNIVSIVTRHVQVFLMSEIANAVGQDLWIGLTSSGRDQFLWTDGQSCDYVNWAKGQPDERSWRWGRRFYDNEKACVVMSVGTSTGKWVTKSCNDTNGYICQRKVDPNLSSAKPTSFPTAYFKMGNNSYKVVTQNMTWQEAKRHCEKDKAKLASILDEWSEAYIELQSLKLNTPLWIGLNKNETEGYFRWIDNWHLHLANWGQDQPHGKYPCVYIDVDGKWKTAPCNRTLFSVCKQSTDVEPPPPEQYEGSCPKEDELDLESMGYHLPHYMVHNLGRVSWIPFRRHCYSFHLDTTNWSDANTNCITKGATLLSIEDPSEQAFIMRNLNFLHDSREFFWIGLYKSNNGEWLWLDKTVLDYTNWDESHDDPDEDRYALIVSSNGNWQTESRWRSKGYICKKDKVLNVGIKQPTEGPPTAAPVRAVHPAVVAVVVLTLVLAAAAAALLLYKRSGRSFTIPFDNPLYSSRGRPRASGLDTNRLTGNVETN